ncbi:hypothetical protein TB2_016569 [Malus domestica]
MEEARKLRSEFLQVLRSRRSGEVPMLVEPAKPVANPLFQEANPPSFSEVRIWFPFGNALYQFGEKDSRKTLFFLGILEGLGFWEVQVG